MYIRDSEIRPYSSNLDESGGLSWKTSLQQGADIGRGPIVCQDIDFASRDKLTLPRLPPGFLCRLPHLVKVIPPAVPPLLHYS